MSGHHSSTTYRFVRLSAIEWEGAFHSLMNYSQPIWNSQSHFSDAGAAVRSHQGSLGKKACLDEVRVDGLECALGLLV